MASAPLKPVVILTKPRSDRRRTILRLLPAAFASLLFHGAGIVLLVLLLKEPLAAPAMDQAQIESVVNADPVEEPGKKNPFLTEDVNPADLDPFRDVNYDNPRKGSVSIPGEPDPREQAGLKDASKLDPPVNLPAPGGWGNGQGGGLPGLTGLVGPGSPGGLVLGGIMVPGGTGGRGGSTRERMLEMGGGTKESEAAVARGLKWLALHQLPDGRWMLDDPRFKDKGTANDIAGTAFGLLPLLGAGYTHKMAEGFGKPVEKALLYLIRKQDKRTGNFGGGMYAHGLATIALCEAYGMTQDPALRPAAQKAINYIVQAQHDGGGWRYAPGQAGDTSVVGWQVMALKSAQMANLDVSEVNMRKIPKYLDGCVAADEGYGYVGPGSTPTMTAVGLLCRQYLQGWGPQNLRMIKAIDNHVRPNGPNPRNMYYTYYASQVMHHFGGQAWKEWNEKMRTSLIAAQDKNNDRMHGSWTSVGDPHGAAGGRLMQTSLSLLTLEVYYRHLPLYYRDGDLKKVAGK